MPSMLRGPEGLRSKRTAVDTGTGEQRTPTAAHAQHISRGSFVNKQKDLGINTTEAHAGQLRREEKEFQSVIAQERDKVGQARSQYEEQQRQLAAAQAQLSGTKIPGAAQVADQQWSKHASGLTTIRIVDAKNNIVGSYKMPADYAKQFQGQRGIWATPVDGGKYFNVSMKERHHVDQLNAEVAKSAQAYQSSYKAQVAKAASPQVKSALGQLKTAQGQIDTARGTVEANAGSIAAAEARIQGAVDNRKQMWADVRGQQANKIKTMASIFSAMKVGGEK
jgi:chromosome segregation ATPase